MADAAMILDTEAPALDTVQLPGHPAVVVDRSRDALLTTFGKDTLSDRYLLQGESYQDLFARVASYYGDDAAHAQRLYLHTSLLARNSRMHPDIETQVPDVVDTIAKRMQRSEDFTAGASRTATMNETPLAPTISSINCARFSAMSARLAQVAAKASADIIAEPARAHEPVELEYVLRYLSDVQRITHAIAEFASGDCLIGRSNG